VLWQRYTLWPENRTLAARVQRKQCGHRPQEETMATLAQAALGSEV
jgi:hypothetical protein